MKFTMRHLMPSDVPLLLPLHDAQNLRDGTDYPLPRFFDHEGKLDPHIALALTVDREGVPQQGVFFESGIVEMCLVGCDPRATAYSRREIEGARYCLRNMKYRGIRCLVPTSRADQIQAPLEAAGFRRGDFVPFYLEI